MSQLKLEVGSKFFNYKDEVVSIVSFDPESGCFVCKEGNNYSIDGERYIGEAYADMPKYDLKEEIK